MEQDLIQPDREAAERMTGRPASSRAEAAYRQLKLDIMTGVYSPNQRLVEADLTLALEVSRATVRLVLTRLQEEGLVESEANRGARVRAVKLTEAIEILEVREVLDGLAAALAAIRATEAQLQGLSVLVSDMADAIAAGDPLLYTGLNERFHDAIYRAAAQASLDRSRELLRFPLGQFGFRASLIPRRNDASLAEHREILTALQRRDADAAERAARHHVAQGRAALIQNQSLPAYDADHF